MILKMRHIITIYIVELMCQQFLFMIAVYPIYRITCMNYEIMQFAANHNYYCSSVKFASHGLPEHSSPTFQHPKILLNYYTVRQLVLVELILFFSVL